MTARRKAFTLIELLTVVAIIAILITLLVLGVNSVVRSSREKTTRTQMDNLKSLIVERQTSGGMQAIYNLYNPVLPPTVPNYPNGSPLPTGAPGTPTPVIFLPMQMTVDVPDRLPRFNGATPPVPMNEIARTQMVMNLLRSVPNNAKMLAGMPSDSFLRPAPPSPFNAPIPIDGWGNPMIYVPGGGISGIFVTGSNGIPQAITKVALDGKGFWVSGGPDGFICGYGDNDNSSTPTAGDKPYGDDNVYSIEN